MGNGQWSPNTYKARASQRQASGKDAFAYSSDAAAVHPSLNPHGLEYRESRDNTEHPDSNPIIVGLDVSGSMGNVVRAIHKDMPNLLNLLLNYKYIPHPQIMFAAFSNGTCDRVPLQVGQFESDNRMDMNLENMILGGSLAGGCDQSYESAELLLYIAARHTSTDAWEKRQRKGYLFLITDEMAYGNIKQAEVANIIGDKLTGDLPLETILAEARERYHIFVIIPMQTKSGQDPQVHNFWISEVDSQHVVRLENGDDVSETMALVIGLTERTIQLEAGIEHLRANGAGERTLVNLRRALGSVGSDSIQGSGSGLTGLNSQDDGKRTKRL